MEYKKVDLFWEILGIITLLEIEAKLKLDAFSYENPEFEKHSNPRFKSKWSNTNA